MRRASDFESSTSDPMDREAIDWVIKRDDGLTEDEEKAFDRWLAGEPRRAERFRFFQNAWQRFDSYETLRVVAARNSQLKRKRIRWPLAAAVASVAAVAVLFISYRGIRSETTPEIAKIYEAMLSTATYERQALPDGSTVELNGDSKAQFRFADGERTVWLLDGEAHFEVAKDPDRPFVVRVGKATVRAVGTAFNVRYTEDNSLEVLVTEGRVRLESGNGFEELTSETETNLKPQIPELSAGQVAKASSVSEPEWSEITSIAEEEIAMRLNWRPVTLDFVDATLREVVEAFNQRNETKFVIQDSELENVPITISFRSDNLMGFARLIKLTSGVEFEQTSEAEIVLRSVTSKE